MLKQDTEVLFDPCPLSPKIFVAIMVDGAKVGSAELWDSYPSQFGFWEFEIAESHRRQGYGEKLLRACKKYAKERGRGIYLRVDFNNEPAIALYKKLGFKDRGEARHLVRLYEWEPKAKRKAS